MIFILLQLFMERKIVNDFIPFANSVFENEIIGIKETMKCINKSFNKAIELISDCRGKVIVCGIGKSGIIARKLAATLASTGTSSFFLHPAEAFHGDLGMIGEKDIIINISNSGETEEILRITPFLQKNNNILISITGNENSTLAKTSHCHLLVNIPSEACPLQLAPTTSTTSTLVLCDALALSLMNKKNFNDLDFARFHPGGNLGRKLLNKVCDEMEVDYTILTSKDDFRSLILSLTESNIGLVLCKQGLNIGIITDGDLRRGLEKFNNQIFDINICEIANFKPKYINENCKYIEAIEAMDEFNITSLIVKSNQGKIVGIIKK